jgi:hypothetical protein
VEPSAIKYCVDVPPTFIRDNAVSEPVTTAEPDTVIGPIERKEPVILTLPVNTCVLLNELPNTLLPLEYTTLDEIVFTTNVVAVNVFATVKFDANDDVAANDADVANEALETELVRKYDAVDANAANDADVAFTANDEDTAEAA